MLDTRFVRENPEMVRELMSLRKDAWDVDGFLRLDEERRRLIGETEALQAKRNESSRAIGALMQSGKAEEAAAAKEAVRDLNEQIKGLENRLGEVAEASEGLLLTIPNLPDATCPIGADEDDNAEVSRWGTPPEFDFEPKPHWELGSGLGILDFERGVKLAGTRFVLLRGWGARLSRALINFMLDTHVAAGYLEWAPPVLANAETLLGTGQLPKFAEDLYQTTDGLYLIPTAEVQLTNIHREEVLEGSVLPLYYAAHTPCFRGEAGSAGRDTRGLIRVHQFDKVELVKFARPEESMDALEGMLKDAERVLELLGLAHRTIVLCTGDMGFAAAKTYDIEVWLPSYNGYKEISSCSNCTDFQARRASIKYRDAEGFKGSRFVHTLNGSGVAVGRCLAAIIENYQLADGSVVVPDVLRPYLGGADRIPASQN
ncbi:MAG: serine--tRNA ligase [Coriobacteriia bacterium]|nr:serine--tRNA ligase [Coriobacteriia bacterium]